MATAGTGNKFKVGSAADRSGRSDPMEGTVEGAGEMAVRSAAGTSLPAAFGFYRRFTCLVVVLMAGLTLTSAAQQSERATALFQPPGTPDCSRLALSSTPRTQLPYMAEMRRLGIARAEIELQAKVVGTLPGDIHITRRVYFGTLDGPGGLPIYTGLRIAALDKAALAEAAKLGNGFDLDLSTQRPVYEAYVTLNYLANANLGWFRGPDWFKPLPCGSAARLCLAAQAGDLVELKALLLDDPSPRALNDALATSVGTLFGNSRAINLLLDAGADVNTRFDGVFGSQTPLLAASACNMPVLLARGADPDARNGVGQNALEWAKSMPSTTPWANAFKLRVLEAALRREHGHDL